MRVSRHVFIATDGHDPNRVNSSSCYPWRPLPTNTPPALLPLGCLASFVGFFTSPLIGRQLPYFP